MNLTLQSQYTTGVAVIRCQGRIVVGKEVGLLQEEVENADMFPVTWLACMTMVGCSMSCLL